MTISDRDFMTSQCFYGLCISKNSELPPLNAPETEWREALDKITTLARIAADMQIAENKKTEN